MCPAIDTPASCEIRPVIHFHHAKNVSAAEIHRGRCEIYGQNVRQWCMFKDGRTVVHNEDDLVQSVDQNI
jgi:hypothetical protein